MQLESTTYHYHVDRPSGSLDDWPVAVVMSYTSQYYRPDSLSFDIHVTHKTHTVTVGTISISGPRILKHGLSANRIGDDYYRAAGAPEFARGYIENVRRAYARG